MEAQSMHNLCKSLVANSDSAVTISLFNLCYGRLIIKRYAFGLGSTSCFPTTYPVRKNGIFLNLKVNKSNLFLIKFANNRSTFQVKISFSACKISALLNMFMNSFTASTDGLHRDAQYTLAMAIMSDAELARSLDV